MIKITKVIIIVSMLVPAISLAQAVGGGGGGMRGGRSRGPGPSKGMKSKKSAVNSGVSNQMASLQTLDNGSGYEVVFEGEMAGQLYDKLQIGHEVVSYKDGNWELKTARGLTCGKHLNSEAYACSQVISEEGVEN